VSVVSFRGFSSVISNETIGDQQHDGFDGDDENSAEIEGFDSPETTEGTEKTAADDLNENGGEDPNGGFARHGELRKCPVTWPGKIQDMMPMV
jgi:hypothetical protein